MFTVAVIVVALVFGFFLVLWVLIFTTHLIERRPVRYLVAAPPDDPDRAKLDPKAAAAPRDETEFNPYASPQGTDYATRQNQAVAALGYTPHGLYRHVK